MTNKQEDTKLHSFYCDNKSFIIDSNTSFIIDSNMFIAFYLEDESRIMSMEFMPTNYPTTTVCIWDNIDNFINGIAWHDWIVKGIKHNKFKEYLKKMNKI